jgi:hypothetical protein
VIAGLLEGISTGSALAPALRLLPPAVVVYPSPAEQAALQLVGELRAGSQS